MQTTFIFFDENDKNDKFSINDNNYSNNNKFFVDNSNNLYNNKFFINNNNIFDYSDQTLTSM